MMFSRLRGGLWLGAAWACLVCVLVHAAPNEPEINPGELPRVAPTDLLQAPQSFRIKPGFRVELAAGEPSVMDPIALSFDERGRMFVVEMRDYSERRQEQLGRIRVLEDADGDGLYEKAGVFAENLAWPTGVLCYGGGVFVGATPHILFLKDTDGDQVADLREVVFTGFGSGVQRLNVQQLLNSFAWGLDNRVHVANGGNGGTITSPKRPELPPLELRGRDFSFDPRTWSMATESGGGQYGMTFDDQGRKFVCSNSSHLRAVMYDDHYVVRNPHLSMPPPSVEIAVDGGAAEVYRISPEEPWRVIRTKWRVAGLVPGPIEGGGRASGYFTSATGLTVYRGDAWPEGFRGDAFIADCGSNLVHRKKIYPDGVGFRAERPADEAKVEFLASRDVWFRPVQMANAPDGCLYVIDMYREVIEHPWSFPASIKKHLDLNSGNDRGRIYRIAPDGFQPKRLPDLSQMPADELVATLQHPNGWHRDTAARLLFERQDRAAVPLLRQLVASPAAGIGRLQALYSLEGMASLTPVDVSAALDAPQPALRRHSLRLLESLTPVQQAAAAPPERLQHLVSDPDPEVRYQLAFTLGALHHADILPHLRELLRTDAASSWMRLAVLNSAGERAAEFLDLLARDSSFVRVLQAEPFLRQLATLIGSRNQPAELERALTVLNGLDSTPLACGLASALGLGVERAGSSLVRSVDAKQLHNVMVRAKDLLGVKEAPLDSQLAAIQVLGQGWFHSVRGMLQPLLEPGQPAGLQKGALDALSGFQEPEVAGILIAAWDGFTPSLRNLAVEALLRRPERIAALLDAFEKGKLRRSDLSATQIEFLRKRPDASLRERAEALLGALPSGSRENILRARSESLALSGSPERGRAIYLERCASCHRLAGQGHLLGPDLESVRSSGKDLLLANIIDPNRELMPKYLNYLAETRDGESFTGLIAVESDSTVVLRQANSLEVTLLRSSIEQLRSLDQSVMPEGLEEGLTDQGLADLMEYVFSARPDPKP